MDASFTCKKNKLSSKCGYVVITCRCLYNTLILVLYHFRTESTEVEIMSETSYIPGLSRLILPQSAASTTSTGSSTFVMPIHLPPTCVAAA